MTSYDTYVFILCLIVLTLMTLIFSSMILMITRQSIRLIRMGAEDQRIYKRYLKTLKRGKKETGWFFKAIAVLFVCALFIVFGFTAYMQIMAEKPTLDKPTLRVVYSDSMSKKYEKNEYLFENDLNDQFSRFDLVVTYQLPKESDLQLYDIVVYEVDDVLLIHRIIEIEEPNDKHPNERYFRLQGDLVEYPDKFPVRYSQMKAIYRGERVPFAGSFVMFLQSPAGYMCFIFLIIEILAAPIIEKRIEKAERARLNEIRGERNFFAREL